MSQLWSRAVCVECVAHASRRAQLCPEVGGHSTAICVIHIALGCGVAIHCNLPPSPQKITNKRTTASGVWVQNHTFAVGTAMEPQGIIAKVSGAIVTENWDHQQKATEAGVLNASGKEPGSQEEKTRQPPPPTPPKKEQNITPGTSGVTWASRQGLFWGWWRPGPQHPTPSPFDSLSHVHGRNPFRTTQSTLE